MATIAEVQAKIDALMGDQVKCPICGHDDWHPIEEIVMLSTVTHEFFLQANAPEEDESPQVQDGLWSALAVAWNCRRCKFLRMHGVEHDELLD